MRVADSDIRIDVDSGGVSIRLPRLTFDISLRQAERLRDVLNTALPERIEDLLHDPRIADRHVLDAADALRSEQEPRQTAAKVERRLHLLSIAGGVEPELSEAFANDQERVEAARDYRRAHGDEDDLYRVDVTGDTGADVLVEAFTNAELAPLCILCRCDATAHVYGFSVCEYHSEHSEDEPRCPNCVSKYTCARCENRNAEHIIRDVALCDRCNNVVQSVAIGDRVRDPIDGTWREIVGIDGLADGGSCHMKDGGVMPLDECAAAEKRLPSESLED